MLRPFLYILFVCTLVFGLPLGIAAQDTDNDTKSLALAYLKAHESDLKKDAPETEQYRALYNLCPAALSAGEIEKAKNYANALIELAPRLEGMPGFGPGMQGTALHIANIVLGHIALNEGKVSDAKRHLLAAATIRKGDAPLSSFGPDMLLAKRLIEKGDRKIALEYLDLCIKFWTYERGRVGEWKEAINAEQMPDFMANLRYYSVGWKYGK